VTTGANGANERQAMIDLLFALGQFACVVGLLYKVVLTFASWRETGDFRGGFDPLVGYQADRAVDRFGEVGQRHPLSRPDTEPLSSGRPQKDAVVVAPPESSFLAIPLRKSGQKTLYRHDAAEAA
jgi:hypothetical protein